MSTHWTVTSLTWSEVLIDGSATLTIDTSSTVMKNATQTSASACQRRGSGAVKISPPPVALGLQRATGGAYFLGGQWRKWRRPVKTSTAPAAATASITSWSRR